MNNVLITGGAGYIGSVMVARFLEQGYSVTVVDNLKLNQNSLYGLCYHPKFKFFNKDARDKQIMTDLIKDIDYIIPLAGLVGAPLCEADPRYAQEINVDAVNMLVKLKSNDQRILFPNTNSGYGVGDNDFCTEESPLKPISVYGKTKVEAEKIVLDSQNSITFRLATVFGPSARMRTDLLVNNFTYKAYSEQLLVLFEENFRRNYIHVEDVSTAFLHGINNFEDMKNQAYNLGLSSANLTKKQLALKIKEHIPELEIISSEFGTDPDKRDYIVSNEKLENTGWQPTQTIDDGIIQLLKMYDMFCNKEPAQGR